MIIPTTYLALLKELFLHYKNPCFMLIASGNVQFLSPDE